MSFETVMDAITDEAVKKAVRLLDVYEAGDIGFDLFVTAMSDLIDQARGRGANAAVQVLRAYVEQALEVPVVVSPAFPPADYSRLTQAVTTILGSDQDTRMQIIRLATAEPLRAAHDTYTSTMAGMPEVSGWVRGLDSNACQLCRWWWREGRVWQPTHRMPTHTGCKCHPVPTVKRTTNFQKEGNEINV